jgi:hypothetical protein
MSVSSRFLKTVRKFLLIALGLGSCAVVARLALGLFIGGMFPGIGYLWDVPLCIDSSNAFVSESIGHFELPPSANNISTACGGMRNGMQGVWTWTYFDMQPADLNVFVNTTMVKLPLSKTGRPDKLECYPCNDISNLKSYLYGRYSIEEWFEEIFIDTSNPAQWRVYFTLLAG